MREYQICKRCIMDVTDPMIKFDDEGICNHCRKFDVLNSLYGYRGEKTDKELEEIVKKIKKAGKNKEYDCVLGISGGVDSAYMAYIAKKLGLRVLAVHVDAGWNTDIAVENIKKVCEKLGYDLHTIVVDWPTMKELQRAYMFSGLPNLDVPQDHVFMAAVYKFARRYGLKYVLSGSNLATEGILPISWGYSASDYKSIKSVYKQNGRGRSLRKYPHFNLLKSIYYKLTLERFKLLNYVPYSKKEAMELLEREFDWKYYGGKHFESRFTKFFQSYYLPNKFGYDKKRAHLSSLIVGGEMTREQAILEMEDNSSYTQQEMLDDRDYILKKLDISLEDWEQKIMKAPNKTEEDYASNKKLIENFVKLNRMLRSKKVKSM